MCLRIFTNGFFLSSALVSACDHDSTTSHVPHFVWGSHPPPILRTDLKILYFSYILANSSLRRCLLHTRTLLEDQIFSRNLPWNNLWNNPQRLVPLPHLHLFAYLLGLRFFHNVNAKVISFSSSFICRLSFHHKS